MIDLSRPEPGDVQTLIETVVNAKLREAEYEGAKAAFTVAIDQVRELIGGDGLAAIHNGERRIGEILTRIEDR